MKVTVLPGTISGSVTSIPSKSQLHRLLICAALADKECLLRTPYTKAEDATATIRCLEALGASIRWEEKGLRVRPIERDKLPASCQLFCGESGSTLRFLLPVVAALGVRADFHLEGRLPERPLSPLDAQLCKNGCRLQRPQRDMLRCEGQLRAGDYELPGDVSSQYITGLLLAFPLLGGESTLSIYEPIESGAYIAMTLQAEAMFGVSPEVSGNMYQIQGNKVFSAPEVLQVEGDWSNAAFWLCAGAMPQGEIKCGNLNQSTLQGDRAVWRMLAQMGAKIQWKDDCLAVSEGERTAVAIDAAEIPDLIPALSVVAAVSDGVTVISNAGRLRIKESDRLSAIAQTLNLLGAKVTEDEAGLRIEGVKRLKGGTVDAWGDHRIAMMAAIASTVCEVPVIIEGAQAVNKSYPAFWSDLAALGKTVIKEEDA